MKKKIIFIIIIFILIFGFVFYKAFIKKEKSPFTLEKVSRGTVLQGVSETGTVKISEEINLSFRNTGRIEKIYVKVGDTVKAGQPLAKLDASQLYIQLTEAQAALEVAQAEYSKLLAGSSPEEIKVAETEVSNAEVSLTSAEQSLNDIKAKAEEDLNNAYEDAFDTLDDSYLKIYNAYNVVSLIARTYFNKNDQEGIVVRENENKIKDVLEPAKSYIDTAKSSSRKEDVDAALQKNKEALLETKSALELIKNTTETITYQNIVSSSDKTSLDTQKSNIITAHTNIVTCQQTISTTKITNNKNINDAKSKVLEAKAKLQKAQDELALKKAPPQKETIDLHQAKIKQSQAQISLLQSQIQETILKSSTNGQITKINKKEDEIVQPGESVISFLTSGPFQIKTDIYEEDIVKVKVGDPVDITFSAIPEKTFKGKVTSVNPAEKLIEGVVYYEVTVDFEENVEGIKPGMTADITIKTALRENVLAIPKKAILKKNNKVYVEVLEGKEIKEKEIEIGIEGTDGMVEVVSGLIEGEEIIVR